MSKCSGTKKLHAQFTYDFSFVGECCEQGRRGLFRRNHTDRMGIKSDDPSQPSTLCRGADGTRDDFLMADVNAIENAQSEMEWSSELR